MLEKEVLEFDKYVKNYDMEEENILRKYQHSFRVMNYSTQIAQSLTLDLSQLELAALIGLLHDIGRFEQYRIYQTYSDIHSVDHANLGIEILKKNNYIENYIQEIEKQNVVINAIYYHNKLAIESNLDKESQLFAKIIRDADKLDIISTQAINKIPEGVIGNIEVLENIYEKKVCKNETIVNEADVVIKMLSWIYDLNFSYSYEFLLNRNIISKKIELLKKHLPSEINIERLENTLIKYSKSRI